MDDKTTEAVPVATEGGTQPSEPSQKQVEQPSSGKDAQLEVALKRIARLEGMMEGEQSKADRLEHTAAKLENLSEELKRYEEKRQLGMKPEEAERAMLLDRMVEDYKKSPESIKVSPKATETGLDFLSPVLKMAGLDANDPDVIELLRSENDPIRQVAKIANIAEERKQAPPKAPPKPASAMTTGEGITVEGETLESVTAELQALMKAPATPATRERIKELSKKHKELLPKK